VQVQVGFPRIREKNDVGRNFHIMPSGRKKEEKKKGILHCHIIPKARVSGGSVLRDAKSSLFITQDSTCMTRVDGNASFLWLHRDELGTKCLLEGLAVGRRRREKTERRSANGEKKEEKGAGGRREGVSFLGYCD